MGETPKSPATPSSANPAVVQEDLANQKQSLAELNFENAKFLASLEARMKLASALSDVELKFMKDLTANLRMQNELVDAYNAKFKKNEDQLRDLIEQREGMESLDNEKRTARLKQLNAIEEDIFNKRQQRIRKENEELEKRQGIIQGEQERIYEEYQNLLKRQRLGEEISEEEIDSLNEKIKRYEAFRAEYEQINIDIQKNNELLQEKFRAEEDLGKAIQRAIDRKKEEMLIDMHNIRASEILRDTKQKLINTADKLTIASARLGETLSGSLAIAIVRTGGLFSALEEIHNFMVLKFSNPEMLMGSFFKFIEDNAIKSFNLVKTNVLELDKSIAAFNKTTGQGEMFRREVSALAGETTKFNATLKEGGEAFEKFYKNFQGFTKLNEAQRYELTLTALKYDQLGFSIDKQAKLFNTLSGSLTKNTAQFERLRKDLVETAITLKMATEDVVTNFEKNIEKFNVYGTKGVEVFKNLQIASKNLAVDFDSLMGVVGQFDQFEAAAQAAGKFNAALGGDYLNALEMIGMKEDERLIRLKQAFDATRMNVDVMNKQQLQLLANASGFKTTTEAMKFFGSSMAQIIANQKEQIDLDNLATKSADITKRLTILGEKLLVMIAPIVPIIEAVVAGITKFAETGFGKFLFGAVGLFITIAGSLVGIVSLFSFLYTLGLNAKIVFDAIRMIFKDKGAALKALITLQEVENKELVGELSLQEKILATQKLQTEEIEKQIALRTTGTAGAAVPMPVMGPTPAGGAPSAPSPAAPAGAPVIVGGAPGSPAPTGTPSKISFGPKLTIGSMLGGMVLGALGSNLKQKGYTQSGQALTTIGGAMSGAGMGSFFGTPGILIGALLGGIMGALSDATIDEKGNVTPLEKGSLGEKTLIVNGKPYKLDKEDRIDIGTKIGKPLMIETPKQEENLNLNPVTDLQKDIEAMSKKITALQIKPTGMPEIKIDTSELKTPEITSEKIVSAISSQKLEKETKEKLRIEQERAVEMQKLLSEKQKLPENANVNVQLAVNLDLEEFNKSTDKRVLNKAVNVLGSKINYLPSPTGGVV